MALSPRVLKEFGALVEAILADDMADARARAVQLRPLFSVPPKEKRRADAVALPAQGWLWNVAVKPVKPALPVIGPETLVPCAFFKVRAMPVRVCLERQVARWPGGNRMKDGAIKKKQAGIYEYCSSGRCEQGKQYREQVPAEWQPRLIANPGRVFYRPDLGEQRRKRRIWIRSNLDVVPDLEHPPGLTDGPEPLDLEDDDVKVILNGG